MIKILPRIKENHEFEKEYWEVIKRNLAKTKKRNGKVIRPQANQKNVNTELIRWKKDYDIKNEKGEAYTVEEIALLDYDKLSKLKEQIDNKCIQIEIGKYECFFEKNKMSKKIYMRKIWTRYIEIYDDMRNAQKERKTMSARIVDYFNMKVCSYCNRTYIDNRNVRDNKTGKIMYKSTAQLDHFFPKEKYPVFALSLYNFVPVCQVCNSKKSETELNVSPHNPEFDFSRRVFTYELDEDFSSEKGIKVKIRKDVDDKLREDIKVLDIDGAYSNNNDVVWEIIEKKRLYDEYRIKEIVENLGLPYSEDEINRLLYGNYIKENDYSKRPLAKLTADIVNEIKRL